MMNLVIYFIHLLFYNNGFLGNYIGPDVDEEEEQDIEQPIFGEQDLSSPVQDQSHIHESNSLMVIDGIISNLKILNMNRYS